MNLLYLREFSHLEGKKFWRKYSLVGDFFNVKQTLWDTYPEIIKEVRKEKATVILDNQQYILKIIPKIEIYFANDKRAYLINEMIKEFIPLDTLNKKVFFTLKDYNDYLKDKIESLALHQFYKYNLQPQIDLSDIQHLRPWPSLLLENRDKTLHRGAILANKPRTLIETVPLSRPIRISNYEALPGYKKRRIHKLMGKRTIEPLRGVGGGGIVPSFINPTYITVEFSPFITNEQKYLEGLVKYFDDQAKDWNLYRDDVEDIKNFAFHLMSDSSKKKRSKLDILVHYIKTHKKRLFTLNLLRQIYKYDVVTKFQSVNNGLYIIRKNNKLLYFIYCLKFDIVEYWILQDTRDGYIDCKELINNYDKNVYYFTISPQNNRLLEYLIVENCKELRTQSQKPPTHIKKIKKYKNFKNNKGVLKVIYFIRKIYYYSDEVMVDINFQTRTLEGTMRPKGLKKIYILNL